MSKPIKEVRESLLKPCPFCGGSAEIEQKGSVRESMIIICTDCGCTVESGDVAGMTEAEYYHWNSRYTV